MLNNIRPTTFVRRTIVLSAVLGASVAVMSAQTSQAAAAPASAEAPANPTFSLQLPATFSTSASDAVLSSSSSDNEVAVNSERFNFVDAMQYGGRRYGRPRYRGGNTNADGSAKYIFFAGGGFGQPLGNTYHYLTPNYGIQVGGGRQFSNHFALPIQFDYDEFGFNQRTISAQAYLYSGDANAADNDIDGKSHVWSFTIDPTYTFYSGQGLGAYVVAGVGFYHKVADFTAPQEEEYCDPYYGCETIDVQSDIDHYSSNAVGFNGGFGITYKLSHFSNERLFGEVRYVFIDNSQRQGVTIENVASAPANATNYYPANSNRTTYIPVKFGLRF